jgi:exoribonuclease R
MSPTKTPLDPTHALAHGLARLRAGLKTPVEFPPEVTAAAELAAQRRPTEHVDRTDWAFVTLDPETATDLDQAFVISRSGQDLMLHYAIADVAWFVDEGGVVDQEAWRRGTTLYLPDGKVRLYPPSLSEGAASLLPDGPRPAVVFAVRVAPDGGVRLDGVERAVIRSRAKLAYDGVTESELPEGFAEIAARLQAAETVRGAARVDPPEQEVERLEAGGYRLRFRKRTRAEDQNASLSLACNIAVAQALAEHRTGLFRVMDEPDEFAVKRLRQTAKAFGLSWAAKESLAAFERRLDPGKPQEAAFMLAVRRAGRAGYAPYRPGETPWHAAVASPYAHATAPLRRLADRYVVMAALAIANGRPPPAAAAEAFERLPDVMARADSVAGQVERAVIELAEAAILRGREGQIFAAVVTDIDERGARIQLCDVPVVTRVAEQGLNVGAEIDVRLASLDTEKGAATFTLAQEARDPTQVA